MSYFKYSFFLISKNKMFFITTIFQIIISSLALSFLMLYTENQNIEISYSKNLNKNNAVYYSGKDIELNNVCDEFFVYETQTFVNNMKSNIIGISNKALEYANFKLYKGRWFNENNEKIEIVVNDLSNFKIGDDVRVSFNDELLDCLVVGIVPNNMIKYRLNGYSTPSNNMTCKFLFEECEKNSIYVYMPINKIDKYKNVFFKSQKYINFSSNISCEELEENLFKLRNNGVVSSIDNMIKNSQNEVKQMVYLLIPLTIMLGLLIIFSTILVILISINNQLSLFAKLYLYGARIIDLFIIIFLYAFYIILFSFIIHIFLKVFVLNKFYRNYGGNNLYLISVIILFVFYLLVIFITLLNSLKKKKILSSIKETL